LAVFLAVGTVIVVWQVGVEHIGDLVFAVGDATVAPGTLDFAGRREVWSRALYMLQDFPFTGIGLNTFPFVANTLYLMQRFPMPITSCSKQESTWDCHRWWPSLACWLDFGLWVGRSTVIPVMERRKPWRWGWDAAC